jgi:hypothetical protein
MATKRELTEQQQWDVEVEEVHAIVNEIRAALADGREALWRVARGVHAFNELRGWQKLGHDTLGEWLAEPDIGWSRTQYFRYVGVWQKYALDRKVDPQRLQQVDLTKAEVVLPALKAGDVTADTALADIEALGWRDLREKYVTKAKSSPSAGTDSATTPTDTSGSKPGEQPEPEDWEPPTAAAGAPSVPDDAPATGELVDEFDPAGPRRAVDGAQPRRPGSCEPCDDPLLPRAERERVARILRELAPSSSGAATGRDRSPRQRLRARPRPNGRGRVH